MPDQTDAQAYNRYSYVHNNPVNFTDSSGHCDDQRQCAAWSGNVKIAQTRQMYSRMMNQSTSVNVAASHNLVTPQTIFNDMAGAAVDGFMAHMEPIMPVVPMVIAALCDFCDVVMTLGNWANGDFHMLDLVAMALPLVPAAARHIDDVADVARYSDDYTPTYTGNSASHVYTHGHAANSVPQPGKSRFYPTEGGQKFTDEVVNHPNVAIYYQSNGNISYTVDDLGRNVGYDKYGNATRGGQVIVQGSPVPNWSQWNPFEVVTQYPK